MNKNNNPYSTLGLPPFSSLSSVKAAYRDLARTLHPDKSSHLASTSASSQQFILISAAYHELLANKEKYDILLRSKAS